MREPLYRRTFDAVTLAAEYPPQFQHAHKAALYEHAYPGGKIPPSTLDVTQWDSEIPDPVSFQNSLTLDRQPNFYDYPPSGPDTPWHVNFADPRLFVAYGSSLFAQDEMQVAEHPLLASVREALAGLGLNTMTVSGGKGTPILIRNAERRLEISTSPDARLGRPSLYGNQFARAPFETVLRATRKLDPPTFSNLIAIAAPGYGQGEYTPEQIKTIFATAYTGFSAARQESAAADRDQPETVIHTGFWGCGAFGGNRTLMVALQVLAAKAAGIRRVVFHTGDSQGLRDADRGFDAAEMIEERCGMSCSFDELVEQTSRLGFRWGFSDGN